MFLGPTALGMAATPCREPGALWKARDRARTAHQEFTASNADGRAREHLLVHLGERPAISGTPTSDGSRHPGVFVCLRRVSMPTFKHTSKYLLSSV